MWLDSHLKPGDTALDVGAHCGIYTVLMAVKCESLERLWLSSLTPMPSKSCYRISR